MFNPGITRHMRDLDRLKTIQAVIDREMKPGRAAEHLRLSVRQIERLVIRYRTEGPVGLISRHRNRTGNRALKSPVAERIVAILREQYADFGPTLAAEKLQTRHGITIAKETVRQLQIASGLLRDSPKSRAIALIDSPCTSRRRRIFAMVSMHSTPVPPYGR
jgi:homeodomain-containing protein